MRIFYPQTGDIPIHRRRGRFEKCFKLAFHGADTDTDTDTDTDISDVPIVQFCKRVHDSLSCTAHVYMCTRAHP